MKPFLKLDNCFIDPPGTQQNKRQIMLNKIAQNMHQIIKSQNKPSSSSPVKRKSAQHHSTGSSPKIRQKDTQRQITEPLSDSQISTKLPNRKYYPKRKLSQEPQLPTLTKFEITFQNPFFAQNPTFCSDRRPIEFQGVVYKRKIKGSL
ncbi:hypothetical protein pb186bvf_013973 [Paramecium bursaria]